ncbi:MAG: hypothetical protein ABEJ28_01830 [Salinigranum sp.]
MFGMSSKGSIGLVLMIVGIAALFPAMAPSASQLFEYVLVPAILVLTLGTYLVGTDMRGRPV